MNISINEWNQEWIQRKVDSGEFASADEVLEKARELIEERARNLAALREEIQRGLDSGDPLPGEQVMAELRERTLSRLPQASQ